MLALTLRYGETVMMGAARLTVLSITADGFAVISVTQEGITTRHALQVEPPDADAPRYTVEVAPGVRVGLSRHQPTSKRQARIIFDAPRDVVIYRGAE